MVPVTGRPLSQRPRLCALRFMLRDPSRTGRLLKVADEIEAMERAEAEQCAPVGNVINLQSRRRVAVPLRAIGDAS